MAGMALLVLGSVSLHAQSDSTVQQEAWNYAVPEAPSIAFLGGGTSKVSRPLSARDLSAQLVNAIDSGGRVRQGVSVEFTPYYLVHHRISLDDYQKPGNVGAYAMANTLISFGTVRSSGDSGSTDLSLGIRTVFFDQSDPMRSKEFTSLLNTIMGNCEPNGPPIQGDTVTEADSTRVAAEFEGCASGPVETARKAWLKRHWNASSFGIGAASGMRLQDSRFSMNRWIGFSFWGAGSVRVGASGLLAGQLQVDHRRENAGQTSHTTLVEGVRLLLGSPAFNLYAEVTTSANLGGAKSDSPAQWTGGVEFKAASNLWITTGFGTRFSTSAEDKALLLANVRWVVSQNSRFRAAKP